MPKPFLPICRARKLSAPAARTLGVENLPGENRLEVKMAANEDAHLYLSGQVGNSYWDTGGITEEETREALDTIPKGTKIHAHINSEGGSVQEGLGIYAAFKERSADLTAHIDGYAVSIASVFPLAASKVISPNSAIWMIHNASCGAYGDDEDMEKAAKMLREHNLMIADIYAEATGKTQKELLADMKAETWIRGSQAVEYGLADACDDTDCSARLHKIPKAWLDRCTNIPANIFNMLSAPQQQGAAKTPTPQQKPNSSMKKKLLALLTANKVSNITETMALDELIEAAQTAVTDGVLSAEDFEAWQTESFPKNKRTKMLVVDEGGDVNGKLLAKIITDRLTDKVTAYVGTKITKAEIKLYVNAMREDEAGTLAILDGKPEMNAGGAAAGLDITMGVPEYPEGLAGKPSPKLIAMADACAGDRTKILAGMKKDYNMLLTDARRSDAVKNENTFTSTFTTNFLILEATTQASPRFAAINMFSRDAKVDPGKPLSSGIYQFNPTAQDGSTTQTNATNFEIGDSTLLPVTVSVAQYTESFHVTNGQLNSGLRMQNLVKAKLNSLGSKLSKVFCAYITAGNFATLSPIIRSFGAFNFSDTQSILAAIQKANFKNVMLNGGYFYKLTNVPGLFQTTPVVPGAGFKDVCGFDYLALHTEWSAAGANINGFACDQTALGIITGQPLIDAPSIPGGILAQASATMPGVEVPITAYAWFNTATRTYWASFDTMFGANALDTSIGQVIATGTPT